MRGIVLGILFIWLAFGGLELVDGAPPSPLLVEARTKMSFYDALLAKAPEKPAVANPSPYLTDGSTVAQVICEDGSAGSAVYLGGGRYVTAAHVVTDDTSHKIVRCLIAGQPVTVEHINVIKDWAIIRAAHFPPYRAVISCDRLSQGETYYGVGYAEGNPWPVSLRLRGWDAYNPDGVAGVGGSLVNGMSGGAINDPDGVDHAIVDSRDDDGIPDAGVVELADTPLCDKRAATR